MASETPAQAALRKAHEAINLLTHYNDSQHADMAHATVDDAVRKALEEAAVIAEKQCEDAPPWRPYGVYNEQCGNDIAAAIRAMKEGGR